MTSRAIALLAALALTGACVEYEAGTSVEVEWSAETPAGLTVERLTVRVASVELIPCESAFAWLSPIGAAHAHGGATVNTDALELAQGAVTGKPLAPPAGRYCQVMATLGAEGADGVVLKGTSAGQPVHARHAARRHLVELDLPLVLNAAHRHTTLKMRLDLRAPQPPTLDFGLRADTAHAHP